MYLQYMREFFVWCLFGFLIWLTLLKREDRAITPLNVAFGIAFCFCGGFVVLVYPVLSKLGVLDPENPT